MPRTPQSDPTHGSANTTLPHVAAPHPLLRPVLEGASTPWEVTVEMDVVASAEEHEVVSLLSTAVESGRVAATSEARLHLGKRVLQSSAASKASESALGEFLDVADSCGVGFCLFKGAAVSRLLYDDPSTRPAADIDVFSDPGNREGVIEVLRAFDERVSLAARSLIARGVPFDSSVSLGRALIDVHTDPFKLPVAQRFTQQLWTRADWIEIGSGRSVRAARPGNLDPHRADPRAAGQFQ